jgi:hypothetical protein
VSDVSVIVRVVMCLAGLALLGAAFVGTYRYPEWNWRYGPARWLGTFGVALLLGGLLNLWIARR